MKSIVKVFIFIRKKRNYEEEIYVVDNKNIHKREVLPCYFILSFNPFPSSFDYRIQNLPSFLLVSTQDAFDIVYLFVMYSEYWIIYYIIQNIILR